MFDPRSEFVAFLLALVVSVFLTFALKRIAYKVGLVDQPQRSNHKTHTRPAALVGGLAIFVAFCFTLLFIDMPLTQLRPLLAGSIVLIVIGVLDDLHELSPAMRFTSQIVACLIMIFMGNNYLTDLGRLVTDEVLELSFLSIPFTVFAVVGVINAFKHVRRYGRPVRHAGRFDSRDSDRAVYAAGQSPVRREPDRAVGCGQWVPGF